MVFAAVETPFSDIDYRETGGNGSADESLEHSIVDTPLHVANIFHINADIYPLLYFRFGKELF